MKQTVTLIAAAAENNALGKDGDLPWHLPDDFRRFKAVTTGHHIIMGRKTLESLPKLLPNRTHVVITRQHNYNCDDCIVVGSLQEALNAAPQDQEVFIIGGGEIFVMALEKADKIDLTRVHANIEADAFFPEINNSEWQLEKEEFHPKDEKHQFDFTFQTFTRKSAL
ncbi:MAG TPA: dihydrofolate reductase [Flavobacterium sp.]|jgi:dihydrofolate reductase